MKRCNQPASHYAITNGFRVCLEHLKRLPEHGEVFMPMLDAEGRCDTPLEPPSIRCLHSPACEDVGRCDDIVCTCGNNCGDSGFFPCDAEGKEVEPMPDEATTGEFQRYKTAEGEPGDTLPIICDRCHVRHGDECQCSEE